MLSLSCINCWTLQNVAYKGKVVWIYEIWNKQAAISYHIREEIKKSGLPGFYLCLTTVFLLVASPWRRDPLYIHKSSGTFIGNKKPAAVSCDWISCSSAHSVVLNFLRKAALTPRFPHTLVSRQDKSKISFDFHTAPVSRLAGYLLLQGSKNKVSWIKTKDD